MNLTIRFFATLKDVIGAPEIYIDLPKASSVKTMLSILVEEKPALAPHLPTALIAVNQKFSDFDLILDQGDEIVIFPPVSGG
jgi:molybdopterin converting factor subunit 1